MGMQAFDNLCTACQDLPLSTAHSGRHRDMKEVSAQRFTHCLSQKVLYQCFSCKTLWLHERDQWGACLGFKLWPGSLSELNRPELNISPAIISKTYTGFGQQLPYR